MTDEASEVMNNLSYTFSKGPGEASNEAFSRACDFVGDLESRLRAAESQVAELRADIKAMTCWRDCPCEARKADVERDAAIKERDEARRERDKFQALLEADISVKLDKERTCPLCNDTPSGFQNYPGQHVRCPGCGKEAGAKEMEELRASNAALQKENERLKAQPPPLCTGSGQPWPYYGVMGVMPCPICRQDVSFLPSSGILVGSVITVHAYRAPASPPGATKDEVRQSTASGEPEVTSPAQRAEQEIVQRGAAARAEHCGSTFDVPFEIDLCECGELRFRHENGTGECQIMGSTCYQFSKAAPPASPPSSSPEATASELEWQVSQLKKMHAAECTRRAAAESERSTLAAKLAAATRELEEARGSADHGLFGLLSDVGTAYRLIETDRECKAMKALRDIADKIRNLRAALAKGEST